MFAHNAQFLEKISEFYNTEPSLFSREIEKDRICSASTNSRPLLDKHVRFRFDTLDKSQGEVIDQKRPRHPRNYSVVEQPKFVVSSYRQSVYSCKHVSQFVGCLVLLLLFVKHSIDLSAQMFERLVCNKPDLFAPNCKTGIKCR